MGKPTPAPAPLAVEEEKEASRKTIRFDPDTLVIVKAANYSTDNAAINGLLRELVKLRKKQAEAELFAANQRQQIADANEVARQWKEKHGDKCAELGQLQAALALVGKFLKPAAL